MSNFALSSVILVLFVLAAGLGLGSLARARFEQRLRIDAAARRRGGAETRAAAHAAASVKQPARPAAKRKAPKAGAARKKTSRAKKAAGPRSKSEGRKRRKPGGRP